MFALRSIKEGCFEKFSKIIHPQSALVMSVTEIRCSISETVIATDSSNAESSA